MALSWNHPLLTTTARESHDDDGLLTVAVISDTGDGGGEQEEQEGQEQEQHQHQGQQQEPPHRAEQHRPGKPRAGHLRASGEVIAVPHQAGRIATSAPIAAQPPVVIDHPEPPEPAAPSPEPRPELPPGAVVDVKTVVKRRLLPNVARALRVYDVFPSIPLRPGLASVERARMVEVCVSDRGAVSEAVFAERSDDDFANTLRAAILTWRYRPLTIDGRPTPFCHLLRVSYRN